MKRFLFSLLFVLGGWIVSAQDVLQSTDTLLIRYGERIVLRYGLSPAADSAFFPLPSISEDSLSIVMNSLNADTQANYVGQSIAFTAFDSGQFTFPSLPIILGKDTLFTKAFQFLAIPTKVDTTNAFFDIKENYAAEWGFSDWIRLYQSEIIGIVLLVIILILLYRFRHKWLPKPKVKVTEPRPSPNQTFEEWLKEHLAKIRAEEKWKHPDLKPYYSDLSFLLRRYIEHRYSIKTLEKTSSEIIAQLKFSALSPEATNRIVYTLNLSDMVKFAKENPSYEDSLGHLDWLEEFIKQTLTELNLKEDSHA